MNSFALFVDDVGGRGCLVYLREPVTRAHGSLVPGEEEGKRRSRRSVVVVPTPETSMKAVPTILMLRLHPCIIIHVPFFILSAEHFGYYSVGTRH